MGFNSSSNAGGRRKSPEYLMPQTVPPPDPIILRKAGRTAVRYALANDLSRGELADLLGMLGLSSKP